MTLAIDDDIQFVAGFKSSMNFLTNSDGRSIQTSGQTFSITVPQSLTLKEKNVSHAIFGAVKNGKRLD